MLLLIGCNSEPIKSATVTDIISHEIDSGFSSCIYDTTEGKISGGCSMGVCLCRAQIGDTVYQDKDGSWDSKP